MTFMYIKELPVVQLISELWNHPKLEYERMKGIL